MIGKQGIEQVRPDLATHDAAIKADIGDYSGQINLQTLLAALGIPDVVAKPLYTCLITDRLDSAAHGLAALKAYVDDLETRLGTPAAGDIATNIGNPAAHTLTSIVAKIGDIAVSLDTLLGARWDGGSDLGTDIAQLLTYTDILDDATNGLANIKSLIDTLTSNLATAAGYIDTEVANILIDTGTTIPGTITTLQMAVDAIQTDLSNATDGLGALKALIDIAQTGITQLLSDTTSLLAEVDIEGATSLADKLTLARAGLLDRLSIIAAGGAGELTAARAAFLDNINQAGLLQVTAARAGYLDNLLPTTVGKPHEIIAGIVQPDVMSYKYFFP